MVKWYHASFPSSWCGFDSRYPLQNSIIHTPKPRKIRFRKARDENKKGHDFRGLYFWLDHQVRACCEKV
jgi:hypothetical protein